MCVLSTKVPIQKKSGNLSNDPHIYIYIYNKKRKNAYKKEHKNVDADLAEQV